MTTPITHTDEPVTAPLGLPATPVGTGRAHRRLGLATFRRYCFFSIVLSIYMLLWFGAIPALAAVDGATWSLVTGLLALTVLSVAIWQLTDRYVPLRERAEDRSGQPWLVVGWTAAAVIAVSFLQRSDEPFWASAPLIMLSLTVVPWSRRRQAAIGALVTVGLTLLGVVAVGGLQDPAADAVGGQVIGVVFIGVMVPSVVLASVWTWDVAAELDAARRTAAALAVADERLRFASELHDIQGHHLQVIALKSELAARLADEHPGRARTEMEQVRALAATALTETRELVHGYRRTTLTAELANASNVLSSAAIDARVDADARSVADRLDPERRHLLGLVVREATTNVLRHSAATWARFELGEQDARIVLRIANDRAATSGRAGSGLASLTDRLAAAGGTLTTERDRDVFRLEVVVPATQGLA
jgi:two-component system, NarL family, sensor histidine kinase DesK